MSRPLASGGQDSAPIPSADSAEAAERRRAEEALRESERRFSVFMAQLPAAAYIKDRDGRILFANEYLRELFGLQECLGSKLQEILPPDVAQAFGAEDQAALALGPIVGLARFKDVHGAFRIFEVRQFPIHLGQGQAMFGCIAVDITDEELAAEKTRSSDARLRAIIDGAPFGAHSYELQPDGRLILVGANRAADRILRISHAALLGKPIEEAFPALRQTEIPDRYRRAAAEGENYTTQQVDYDEGGIRGAFEVHAVQTEQNRMTAFFRDITEAKKAELALRESEHRFRTVVQNAEAVVFVLDKNGVFLLSEGKGLARLGLKPGEVVGRSALGMYEDYPEVIQGLRRALVGESMRTITRVKGLVYDTVYSAQVGLEGEPAGVIGIALDITEQVRAQEALRESERKYRELVELANSIILRWTPEGRITFLNEFGLRFFGYAAEEILGHHVVGTIVPEQESTGRGMRQLVEQICLDPKAFASNVNENVRRDGKRVWVAWTNKTILDENGRVKELLSIGTDLTERRRLEEQLRQAQKMEAIGQLAGGVAHDFNNILTVILGNAGLLRNSASLLPDQAGMAHQIIEAAERAAALTRQLLLFSRKQVMRIATLDLNEVVGNMTRMLQRILGEDVSLRGDYAPDVPPIAGDAGMIEQVLLNLAVNARDAMPKGGRLTLQTYACSHKPPGSDAAVNCVCLTVADTGCGISSEVLPHIFEPFFTTKPIGKGTGLGLASVYGIVQLHRGWIEVASEVGKGTTFRILLPEDTSPPAERKRQTTNQTLPRGNETLLVVEDEPALRSLASNLLQRCGYRVFSAESGIGALEIWGAQKDAIQLLLTDMIMPDGITGRELGQRLQEERPGLKVIYTSGYSSELIGWEGALQEGVNYLQKPYSFATLAQAVRRRLDLPG